MWNLFKDLSEIRKKFPILENCAYLISNSLGAVPGSVRGRLEHYYTLWAEIGVGAWKNEWWDLSRRIGDKIAALIGADSDTVTMLTHATQCHWIVLSTLFQQQGKSRRRVIMTELDFPSSIYAVSQIAKAMDWQVELIKCEGESGLVVDKILNRLDEDVLCVATSHVYFKSAYVQNISAIAARAQKVGALTLIDGYHAPGVLPVDVKCLGVDFYIGGCLKWLCGGPGNAFLYVAPQLNERLNPALTGWLAHENSFLFTHEFSPATGSNKFQSGTPPVPCLYAAEPGLDIITEIGVSAIREKSLIQTDLVIDQAGERGWEVLTPREHALRGGAVSVVIPHAWQVKQALEEYNIRVDFRKGDKKESDVIRLGPHFYTQDAEIELFFRKSESIIVSGEFKKYSSEIKHVT